MTTTRGSPKPGLVLVMSALLLLAGCAPSSASDDPGRTTGAVVSEPADRSPSTARRAAGASVADPAVQRYRSLRTHRTVAPPVRVTAPAIGVSSGLQRLARNEDGTVEVPTEWHRAGWYRDGPKPGQPGPAVILGHVDSKAGPAVFFRLGALRRGDEINVTRADGSVVAFVVERVEHHRKVRFPTYDVYLPTLRPTLRLVTCGGPFDSASGHYLDNVVVFAGLST